MGLKTNIFLNREQLAAALRNPSSWTLIAVNLGLILAVAIANWGAKLFLIPFFIVHYGMFCYGHGVFVFSLFSDNRFNSPNADYHQAINLLTPDMRLAIGLLAASHFYSFLRNYIAAGEYKHTNPGALMMRPYGRIVVLHITIILGGMLTMALGDPLGLLIVLMILKTSVDLAMHQAERNKYQGI